VLCLIKGPSVIPALAYFIFRFVRRPPVHAHTGLAGWIGIQDTPDDVTRWRSAIKEELEMIGSPRSIDDLEIVSMLFFDITSEKTDQTPKGKLTPSMTGTPQQLIDNLKRYKEAGLTLPLLWHLFKGVPTAMGLPRICGHSG
jgi:dimethylsulfone monooxygenase